MARQGVALDHTTVKADQWVEGDFSAAELAIARQAGLQVDVQIADVQRHYATQLQQPAPSQRPQSGLQCDPAPSYAWPSSVPMGSMGGYLTLDEVYQELDQLAQQWPNLVSVKQPISPLMTHEGRPLYYVRLSDNAATDENEPEMLYTGLHHAREPISITQLLYFMRFLLENYAANPEIKRLVDHTELYFVPVLNPDGYVYNATTNPGGGGMWRKNRRDNQDGTFGVDLNRNYAGHWGFDDLGSSPDSFSDVYRGTAAFSEPETQAIRDFSLQHQFRLALNYHAYGNLFIYPYGYAANVFTPDSAQYADYGFWLTRTDRYTFGTSNQTVAYFVNGDSDEWHYSTVTGTKPKTFSVTPEIGKASEGFWPPTWRIEELCRENLTRNLNAARLLLTDAVASDQSPRFLAHRSTAARFELKQLGLQVPGQYTVSVVPLTAGVTAGPPRTLTLAQVEATVADSIPLTIGASVQPGQAVRYVLSVDNGQFVRRDTLDKAFGVPVVAFSSDGTSLAGWDAANTFWDVDASSYHSAPASLADSPGVDYAGSFTTNGITSLPIDLRGATHAQLTYWARWAIETRFDYAQVSVSADNGATWQPLCGRLTRPGNAFQRDNEPLYDGFRTAWEKESISLDDFAGQTILLRFVMQSDAGTEFDGILIDDLLVEKVGTVTGLAAAAPTLSLQALPNPATTALTLRFTALTSPATVLVRDALGRLVATAAVGVGATSCQLPTAGWPAGLYHTQLLSAAGSAATKVVVQP